MPLINAHLFLRTCTEKREDFEIFLQSISETEYYKNLSTHFKTKLIDYRKTKEHYEKLKKDFLEKFNNCLDPNFLIDKELKGFSDFLDLNFNESDYYVGAFDGIKSFTRQGFIWVTTGKTILIEDFFLMKHPVYFSKQFPVNIEDLRECWNIAYYDLGQSAKGCAEGLYVQFLKEKKIEINNSNPENLNKNEPLPEYEFKRAAQKIAWLHELGVLKTILDKTNYNYYKAANIIHSFTDLKQDTIRKGLEAIFKPNPGNEKNNPLNNPENILFISEMKRKLKLDKEKED